MISMESTTSSVAPSIIYTPCNGSERTPAMQNQAVESMSPWKVYLYNPSLWVLLMILASMLEHTTRCGDAYR